MGAMKYEKVENQFFGSSVQGFDLRLTNFACSRFNSLTLNLLFSELFSLMHYMGTGHHFGFSQKCSFLTLGARSSCPVWARNPKQVPKGTLVIYFNSHCMSLLLTQVKYWVNCISQKGRPIRPPPPGRERVKDRMLIYMTKRSWL